MPLGQLRLFLLPPFRCVLSCFLCRCFGFSLLEDWASLFDHGVTYLRSLGLAEPAFGVVEGLGVLGFESVAIRLPVTIRPPAAFVIGFPFLTILPSRFPNVDSVLVSSG